MERRAKVERETKETDIYLEFSLDGFGDYDIDTGIPFFDHLLSSFCKHGNFDLKIKAKGDINCDPHHLVEDLGISLGESFSKALGKKIGIKRFGFAKIPMDEALAEVVCDICGRPNLFYKKPEPFPQIQTFDCELVYDFFKGFCDEAKITLHISIISGRSGHHMLEALFKAFGLALFEATRKVSEEIPSTKGVL